MISKQFESTEFQPQATRFLLADEHLERILALAKQQRAAYITGLFTAARDWLADYRRVVRAIAPTSLIRSAPQA